MRMARLAALLLLTAACATAPKAPVAPPEPWTEVPSRALDALCSSAVNGEGIGRDTPVAVRMTSQPLVTEASLHSLAKAYLAKKVLQRLDAPPAVPVRLPEAGCAWIEAAKQPARDQYLLEVSAPIANPFTRAESGIFARISLGAQSAYWYWVPLTRRNGRVLAGGVRTLDARE